MSQTAENTDNSTISELEACEEMQAYFKENKLLALACRETELDLDAARHALKGTYRKIPMMTAIVLTKWVALWRAAEDERMALSNIVVCLAQK